jgi:mannose-6-phosphate isomerase-like protein (cupin superfamily)
MQIQRLFDAPTIPINLVAKLLHKSDDIELIHLTLNEGETLDLHTNVVDVIFYVLSGEGKLTVNHFSQKITPNTSIRVSKNKMRGWENIGVKKLELLVIKIL